MARTEGVGKFLLKVGVMGKGDDCVNGDKFGSCGGENVKTREGWW